MTALAATSEHDTVCTDFNDERKSGTFRISIRPVTDAEIELYMDLVHQVVARVLRRLPRSVLREDLVAAGTYGLMDALRKTQATTRDDRFEGYAKIRIRGAIIDELRNQDWLARTARADANAQARAADRSTSTTFVGLDDLPEAQRNLASMGASPYELTARLSERSALAKAVSSLPEREAHIIDLHYFQGVQFKDIAASMNVSEARVSQLHTRALSMLKPLLAAQADDFAA